MRTLVTLDAEADVDVPLQHLDLEIAKISNAVIIVPSPAPYVGA